MWTIFRLTYPDSFTPYALLWVVRAGEFHHGLVEMLSLQQSLTVMLCHVTGCSLVTMKPSTHWPSWPLPAACKRSKISHLLILTLKTFTIIRNQTNFLFDLFFRVEIFVNLFKLKKTCPTLYLLSSTWMLHRQLYFSKLFCFFFPPHHSLVLYFWKSNILLPACIYSSFLFNSGQIL